MNEKKLIDYFCFLGTPRLSSSSSLSSPPTTPAVFEVEEKSVVETKEDLDEPESAIGEGSSPLVQDDRK